MTGLAPMDLNRLERAGWSVIAVRAFAITIGEANILRTLVLAPGKEVSSNILASCLRSYDHAGPCTSAASRLTCRVARIRTALEAAGLPRSAILTAVDASYSITPLYARRIRQIVEGQNGQD